MAVVTAVVTVVTVVTGTDDPDLLILPTAQIIARILNAHR